MLIHSSRVFDPWRGGHALACESGYRDARFCEHPMESYALRSSPGNALCAFPDEVTKPDPTIHYHKPRYHTFRCSC
nr:MAG TPA: hypothetical protein [Caudoviricetes sp.]